MLPRPVTLDIDDRLAEAILLATASNPAERDCQAFESWFEDHDDVSMANMYLSLASTIQSVSCTKPTSHLMIIAVMKYWRRTG